MSEIYGKYDVCYRILAWGSRFQEMGGCIAVEKRRKVRPTINKNRELYYKTSCLSCA